jgi:ketosteroid isomerase-like protein
MSENEILGLEDKRFAAMTGKDWQALDALLHDQLLYTHSSGVTDTKAVCMDAMKAGRTVYKSAKQSDRKVRFYGDTALVTGKAAIEAEVNGQARSMRLCYLDVWTKTPQGWKFVAWQSTPQPAA